jgi:type III restriction enzyme
MTSKKKTAMTPRTTWATTAMRDELVFAVDGTTASAAEPAKFAEAGLREREHLQEWVAQDVKLPSQFAALVLKVREFLETKAFGERVDLSARDMIKAISTGAAQYVTVKTFATALRGLVVEKLALSLEGQGRRLSETMPFPFSRPTFAASKTVFNLVAADNQFERDYAQFLHDASDVESFAKLPGRFGFAIEYTDSATNLRYYEPDFVAVGIGG